MTKIRTSPSSEAKSNPSTKKSLATYKASVLAFVKRQHRVSTSTKILFVLAASAMLLGFIFAGAIGLKFAMLYMIADNAKKSGRADGNVYMRNGRIRGMAIPANPQTAYQTQQRSNLGSLSAAWNSLTAVQQAAWNAYSIQDTDRFGRQVFVTGKAAYVSLNRNLFNIGGVAIDTPPLQIGVPSPTTVSLVVDTAPADLFEITTTPTPIPADNSWLVYATRGMSAGTFHPSASEYRIVDYLATGAASPHDMTAAYVARFGSPVVGTKVFVKLKAIHDDKGIASAEIVGSAIVT